MPKSAVHKYDPKKTFSCSMGELVPVNIIECLPGDKINHDLSMLLRTQPLVSPVMHDVYCDVKHFFVPNRLVWDNWEDFMTGGDNGLAAPVYPTMVAPASTGYDVGSLADYLGLPTGVPNYQHSALPFRAYNLIYNHWFRDQQLITPLVISKASGPDTTTDKTLQMACWGRDRFTTARPAPQLGPSVVIPLTGNANVISDGTAPTVNGGGTTNNVLQATNSGGSSRINGTTGFSSITNMTWGNNTGLDADLTGVSAVDIDDLRLASAYQRMLELFNSTGSRYVEYIQNFFGYPIQDARLQDPELLGSGSTRFQFSEVLQTAQGTDPVGYMKGHGITALKSNRYKYTAPEHGFVISVLCVRPKTQYVQGILKLWNRFGRFDYFQPQLAHVGDQPIFNREIYAAHTNPAGVFGYAPAWDDYRYIPDTVAGEFRTTLNYWHMARIFSSDPALNATFVKANPTTRVFSSTNTDQMYISSKNRIIMRRPIPKFPVPRLM